MPTGETITGSLDDSLPTIIAAARIVSEFEGSVQKIAEKHTLSEGTGLTWHEVSFAKLTGQPVTETTELDNPQQLSDADFAITPTVIAIHTVVTDRVRARISKNALGQIGGLAQNAIERQKSLDGHTAIDGFVAAAGPSAGNSVELADISAARAIVAFGGGNEPGLAPYNMVMHGFGIKDIEAEVASPAAIVLGEQSSGFTARVFQEGFTGTIYGVNIFEDNLITINSLDDAKAGLWAKGALVIVQGRARRPVTIRNEKYGGGADEMLIYDEYAYGERSSGNWARELEHDADTPA
jgi:hypothetical protein